MAARFSALLKLAFIDAGRYYAQNIRWQCAMKCVMKFVYSMALISTYLLAACTPTVQVAMPSEPITINLNVRIEHEIRVKVDEELDDVFAQNADLF
jgi:hypothetical protein